MNSIGDMVSLSNTPGTLTYTYAMWSEGLLFLAASDSHALSVASSQMRCPAFSVSSPQISTCGFLEDQIMVVSPLLT